VRAVVIEELGGPDVMQLREWPGPVPDFGQVLIDVEFAGVNYMDTGTRTRGAAHGRMPFVPGVEGAGRIAALGEGVADYAVGDRVAWIYNWGSYAEKIAAPVNQVVPIPDDIPSDVAAATMMQGLTAHHFVEEVAPLTEGETALVHAAAGGVGRILIQLLRLRGARVIALVSRAEKIPVAEAAGADQVLISSDGDFVDRVKEFTDGEGVHAVFDGGGFTTFWPSIEVLRRVGTLVYFGPLMGDVPTVRLLDLPKSVKITYAVFRDHIHSQDLLLQHSRDLFDKIREGTLQIDISRRYRLDEARQAHIDIESRRTTGKLLLDARH
jgi:NADPH:quinone reductase